jgi:hypothetical protein
VNGVAAPGRRVQEVAEWAANEYFKQKNIYIFSALYKAI